MSTVFAWIALFLVVWVVGAIYKRMNPRQQRTVDKVGGAAVSVLVYGMVIVPTVLLAFGIVWVLVSMLVD